MVRRRLLYYCGLYAIVTYIIYTRYKYNNTQEEVTSTFVPTTSGPMDIYESAINSGEDEETHQVWLNIIRKSYLIPPSEKWYNLSMVHDWDNSGVQALHEALVKVLVTKKTDNKSPKFFVEYKANDGMFLSNSLPFEMIYGWTGLLVEADPVALEQLYQKQRKAWISNSCLSNTSYPYEVTMMGRKTWTNSSFLPNRLISHPEEFVSFKANCIPIGFLLSVLNVTAVDYFSLKTEGSELNIIKSIPFDKIFIKVLSIEVREESEEELRMFMNDNDYYLYTTVAGPFVNDAIFVHLDYATKFQLRL